MDSVAPAPVGRRLRQRAGAARRHAAVRRARGADRRHPHRSPGRAPRRARLQRRRQDHAVQLHHRRLSADLGHHPLLRRGRDQLPAPRAHPPRPAPHLPDLRAVRRPVGARQRLPRLPRRLARALLAAAPAARTTRCCKRPKPDPGRASDAGAGTSWSRELAHGQQRQLEIALALAGAPRFILFDEPAAGLSPTERARAGRDPDLAARPHRLHHHRARHGRRAARRRERDDDAQRPHLQGGPAAGDREPTRRCRSSTSEAAMADASRRAARRPSRSGASTSTTATRMRCRAST